LFSLFLLLLPSPSALLLLPLSLLSLLKQTNKKFRGEKSEKKKNKLPFFIFYAGC
jgi:hypothetical protein